MAGLTGHGAGPTGRSLVDGLPFPDVCVVGNHDLDDPSARAAWTAVHGPANFTFAYGHTRFVALDAPPRETPGAPSAHRRRRWTSWTARRRRRPSRTGRTGR